MRVPQLSTLAPRHIVGEKGIEPILAVSCKQIMNCCQLPFSETFSFILPCYRYTIPQFKQPCHQNKLRSLCLRLYAHTYSYFYLLSTKLSSKNPSSFSYFLMWYLFLIDDRIGSFLYSHEFTVISIMLGAPFSASYLNLYSTLLSQCYEQQKQLKLGEFYS